MNLLNNGVTPSGPQVLIGASGRCTLSELWPAMPYWSAQCPTAPSALDRFSPRCAIQSCSLCYRVRCWLLRHASQKHNTAVPKDALCVGWGWLGSSQQHTSIFHVCFLTAENLANQSKELDRELHPHECSNKEFGTNREDFGTLIIIVVWRFDHPI